MPLKLKKIVKKLVSVLVTFTLVTAIRKKAIKTVKTTEAVKTSGTSENNKEGKGDKYSGNLVQVLCI